MAITAVTPTFAAEIGDVDLSQQIEPTDLAAIKDAFTKYAVLIFPDQHLSQDASSQYRPKSKTSDCGNRTDSPWIKTLLQRPLGMHMLVRLAAKNTPMVAFSACASCFGASAAVTEMGGPRPTTLSAK